VDVDVTWGETDGEGLASSVLCPVVGKNNNYIDPGVFGTVSDTNTQLIPV
jgi:hypothetical protein